MRSSSTQTLRLHTIERYDEASADAVAAVRVTLSTPDLHLYASSITILCDMTGIRYFMYHWRIISAVAFISVLATIQMVTVLIGYAWLSARNRAHSDSMNGEEDLDDYSDSMDQNDDDDSNTSYEDESNDDELEESNRAAVASERDESEGGGNSEEATLNQESKEGSEPFPSYPGSGESIWMAKMVAAAPSRYLHPRRASASDDPSD